MASVFFDTKTDLIGDSISALPFMLERAQKYGRPVFIGPRFNRWVWEGLKWEPHWQRKDAPDPSDIVIPVEPSRSWEYGKANGWPCHISEMHFRVAGVAPRFLFEVPLPLIQTTDHVDIAIAPFASNTDGNHNYIKIWPTLYWQDFCRWAAGEGRTVTLLCSEQDDHRPYTELPGVLLYAGHSLPRVIDVVARANLLVTIDTGVSHIGQMLRKTNHVLIYPRTLPERFNETPFGQNVYGANPHGIPPQAVIGAARRLLDKQSLST